MLALYLLIVRLLYRPGHVCITSAPLRALKFLNMQIKRTQNWSISLFFDDGAPVASEDCVISFCTVIKGARELFNWFIACEISDCLCELILKRYCFIFNTVELLFWQNSFFLYSFLEKKRKNYSECCAKKVFILIVMFEAFFLNEYLMNRKYNSCYFKTTAWIFHLL